MAATSPLRAERPLPYLTRVSLSTRKGVHNFRTLRVCLQWEKRKQSHDPPDNGTTAKRTTLWVLNPQRGDPFWLFRSKISDPSPTSWPPAICGTAAESGKKIQLITRPLQALMDTRLTAPRKEKILETTVQKEIEALRHMTLSQLRQKHAEVFGEETRSHHKQFLFRRIAWRIQALAEGGLSERARRRALEIANDADLRVRAPKTAFQQDVGFSLNGTVQRSLAPQTDPRLPAVGEEIARDYKGRSIVVKVREGGFEYEGKLYKSLSAIARVVTGTKWNGFLFFGLASGDGGANEKR